MSDLKDSFREWNRRKKKAREKMVVCDWCGWDDGKKVWPNEACDRCGKITERGGK